MQVTVLGGAAAGGNTGMGCSGYLFESEGAQVVVDLGPGTMLELRQHCDKGVVGVNWTAKMAAVNSLWGAPRIHGELLKLGFTVSQTTVARYMCRHRPLPSQTWRTFLANHVHQAGRC